MEEQINQIKKVQETLKKLAEQNSENFNLKYDLDNSSLCLQSIIIELQLQSLSFDLPKACLEIELNKGRDNDI